jgi:hypothetical protein
LLIALNSSPLVTMYADVRLPFILQGKNMKSLYRVVPLLAAFAIPNAPGAESGKMDSANPADSKAVVPAVNYVSPFKDYKPFGNTKITPWKPANDLTHQIGGWRAYLKEASQPDATEPSPNMDKPAAVPKAKEPDAVPKHHQH